MSTQDPVADMMTCIRNAQMMSIKQVHTPFSKLKGNLLRVLKEEGYIDNFQIVSVDNKRNIQIVLKYYQGKPVIEKLKRVSKPSLRVYRGCDDIPLIRGGLGITILSTPKGVMSDKQARTERIGGEILCTVE